MYSTAGKMPSPRLASVVGTQTGNRAAVRHARDLLLIEMGGVNQGTSVHQRQKRLYSHATGRSPLHASCH